jgi:hypothetical protein
VANSLLQPSFTGGELSPSLYGRVDLAKYQTSLKTCRNFIAMLYGGVRNRPGTRFIAEVANSSYRSRLIPFAFSTEQTYVLEFSHLKMRVFKDGGLVVYSSGPNAGDPFELVTPYPASVLPDLKFTQSADVMTLVHPSYPPQSLSRTDHDAWTIADFQNTNGPFQDVNVDQAKTVYTSAATGSGITLTTNFNVFDSSYVGSFVYIEMAPNKSVEAWETSKRTYQNDVIKASGRFYKATSANPASLARITGTLRPSHTEGREWDGTGNEEGAVYRAPGSSTNADAFVGVEWEYLHSGFGVAQITAVTNATTATATVIKRLPDEVVGSGNATYRWAFEAWGNTQGYPSCVTYHQQRMVFANTPAQPQTVWMSRTSAFLDFATSNPVVDDDAITFTVASRQVNAIRHMISIDKLVLLTSGGEWIVSGGDQDVITPASVTARIQGYRGSSQIPPIVIGNTALYLQDKGQTVRDLGYEFATDSYTGNDLTILASHLVVGRQIQEWAYQQVPFSTVWSVRDDGKLLGMTYMREQQVVGWHPHDTDGLFESVCSISEGNEDAVYVSVRRTVDGTTSRYIERFASRTIFDIKDAFFVDSGLSYDGRNTSATTMTLTTSSGWTFNGGNTFTLTASASYFVDGDIGSEIHFTDDDGRILRMTITARSSGTVVTVTLNRDVPTELRATATTSWAHARKTFASLDHLEGKTLSILTDGHVHPQLEVDGGEITIDYCATVVHAGLPIESDFETLDISVPGGGETVRDKQKNVATVRLIVEESRGIFAGKDATNLLEYKQRASENYDDPVEVLTGLAEIRIVSNWNTGGRIFVRQDDPLPLSILAVIPEVAVGGA